MTKPRKLRAPRTARARNLALAIGFFCMAAAAVNFAITANNHTDEFLVASRDMPAGSAFVATDTSAASVNLGPSASQYLKAGEVPEGGYLLGPVRSGQLIPRSMLASAIIDERVPVVVQSAMGLPNGLVAGASVDVWVAPITEGKTFGEPFVLVLGAEVSQLIENKEMFATQTPAVEMWVPLDAVGPILRSVSAGDKISLILRPTLADG